MDAVVLLPGPPASVLGSTVDTWATVAVAIGTVGTVVYALFRDYFVAARRRPRLELRFDRTGSDQLVHRAEDGSGAAHVRMRVVNQKGKDTADDVVVMVTELRQLVDPEQTTAETRPIGLPLIWSGSDPPLAVASVHPGSERHVDLLHADGSGAPPLCLGVTPAAAGRHALDAGTHEISVEVRARNADAIRYAIGVFWDGAPPGTEALWDHLRVEPPRELR